MKLRWLLVLLALSAFTPTLSAQSSSSDSLAVRAETEISNGQFQNALNLYLQASYTDPGNTGYRVRIGTLYGWLGQFSKGIEYIQEIHKRYPDNIDIMLQLAQLHGWNESFNEAEYYYRLVIEQSPTNEPAFTGLARIFSWMQRYDEALDYYERALLFNPESDAALMGMATVHSWKNEYALSLTYLDRVLTLDPENRAALRLKAKVLGWNNQTEEARSLYLKLIEEDASDSESRLGLSVLYNQTGRFTKAYQQARLAGDSPASEKESDLIIRSIHTRMAPETETMYKYPWDSDQNKLHIWGERVSFGVTPSLRSGIIYTGFSAANDLTGASASAHQIITDWNYTRSNRVSVRSNAGISAYPGNGNRLSFGSAYIHNYRNMTVSAGFNRYYILETPQLIDGKIGANETTFRWDKVKQPYSVTAAFIYAVMTDGNRRYTLQSHYLRTYQFRSVALISGVKANYLSYLNNQFSSYFSPKHLTVISVTNNLSYSVTDNLSVSGLFDTGTQFLKLYNVDAEKPRFSYQLQMALTYQASRQVRIEAGYLYSTLLTASNQASSAAYWYQMAEIKLHINLSAAYNPFVRLYP